MGHIPAKVIQTIYQHHERLDGSGFPRGESGARIGKQAQVVGVADHYCAMIAGRLGRGSLPPHRAVQLLLSVGSRLYAEEILEKFVRIVGAYPIGTLVLLSSDELAVVCGVSELDLLKPEVAIIFDANRLHIPTPERCLDLASEDENPEGITIQAAAELEKFGVNYIEWLTQ